MSAACKCRHCSTPAAARPAEEVVHLPVDLPDTPREFRVHHDGRTQDCTLHPDGTMTAVMAGQVLRNALTFDEMRERNWATARIEWDPAPLDEAPATEEAVQEPLTLDAAPERAA